MKKSRIIAAFTAALMICGIMSGCSKDNAAEDINSADTNANIAAETVQTAAEVPPLDISQVPDYDSGKFGSVSLDTAFVQLGNTARLREKLDKMKSGEEVTVGFIGGSITEGISAGAEDCYAKLTYNFLAERYGTGDNVKYVNAGLSGTPSILGNLRLERDILSKGADIIFVEFAVNDGGDKLYQESFDSLVQTALTAENQPAVILLFNRTENGHTTQEYMQKIGEHYELPMISSAAALTEALDSGSITWADYSNDSSHPNYDGHKLVAAMLESLFVRLEASTAADGEYTVKEGLHGAPYKNALMAERGYDNSDSRLNITDEGSFAAEAGYTAGFTGGWKYDGTGSEPMKMKVTGNSLFLICKRNNNADMGKLEVYINGNRAKIIDTNDKDGWGDPFAYQVIKWQSSKEMDVEIRIAEGSEQKCTEILAIGVSAD